MFSKHELILVIGQSGAGRTTVIHMLDDQGFDTLDNVPLHLISRVASIDLEDKPLAIGLDIRSKNFSLENLTKELNNWSKLANSKVVILFLECSLEVLIKRFSVSRRPHPFQSEPNLELSIKKELEVISPLRESADMVIDTSEFSPNELRLKLSSIFPLLPNRSIQIVIQSFSFQRVLPKGLDMIFDCRFLKNPNWVNKLKNLDGTNSEVVKFLSRDKNWGQFKKNLIEMMIFLIPAFEKEGKSYLSVGFGCTGGQHRSVFVSTQLYKALMKKKFDVKIFHTVVNK